MNDNHTLAAIRLLVRLLQRDAAGVQRCLEARPKALAELAAVAEDAALSVVLLRALEGSAWAQALSVERREALARRRERQATRCAALEKGLARVAAAFDAVGLPFMLLKGPYLAARFYGNPQGREFVDLDLLVRRADRRRALRVLEKGGFARRSRILGSEALSAFFVHGFDYAADGVNLDLHWGLARHPSLHLDESRIWARKATFTIDGRRYDIIADEDEVTLGVLSLLRDIERGRPKLKNVVDLIQVMATFDATMAWDALLAKGRSSGTWKALVNVLSLCLDAASAHDLAPRLTATLAQQAKRRLDSDAAELLRCRGSTRRRLANRLWAARSYEATLGSWFAWWIVSLPFRRAVHGWPRPGAPNHGAAP